MPVLDDIVAQNPWWAPPFPTHEDPRLAGHLESSAHESVSSLLRIPHTPDHGHPGFYDMAVSQHYAGCLQAR